MSVGHLGTSFTKVDVAVTQFWATDVESSLTDDPLVSLYAPVGLSLRRQHEAEESGAKPHSGLNPVDGLIAQGERLEQLQRNVDAEMAYRSAYALVSDSIDAVPIWPPCSRGSSRRRKRSRIGKKATTLSPGREAARMYEFAVETDPGYENGFLNLGLVLGLAGTTGRPPRHSSRHSLHRTLRSKCVTATKARSTGESQYAESVTREHGRTQKRSAGKTITLDSVPRAITAARV